MLRDFRFGLQFTTGQEINPVETAKQAEDAGFDVLLASDHVGPGRSPLPTLTASAVATSTLRIGTFVLNADMRNPVQLAWDVSTIDHISGGRFELGLGAGHTPHEYAETGTGLLGPADRKAALRERTEIIRQLLDGVTVDWHGDHHQLSGANIDRSFQDHLPILVGGNGATLLAHAAQHADIIGLQGLGVTLEDGHRHTVKWTTEHLDAQIAQIRASAGDRINDVELNALVQVVDVTDDPGSSIADLTERVTGLTAQMAAEIPYALIGSVNEIVDKLHMCRERWGITYFAVRDLEAFAPVISAISR